MTAVNLKTLLNKANKNKYINGFFEIILVEEGYKFIGSNGFIGQATSTNLKKNGGIDGLGILGKGG